jgi:hypothetical protein
MKCHVVDQSFPKRKGVKEEKVRSISTPGKRLRENQTKAAQGNHGEERVALGDYILDISIFFIATHLSVISYTYVCNTPSSCTSSISMVVNLAKWSCTACTYFVYYFM